MHFGVAAVPPISTPVLGYVLFAKATTRRPRDRTAQDRGLRGPSLGTLNISSECGRKTNPELYP